MASVQLFSRSFSFILYLSQRPRGLAGPAPPPGNTPLSPHSGWDDFRSKEGTEDGRSLGGEESKHRESGDGSIVQIWGINRVDMNGGEERMPGLVSEVILWPMQFGFWAPVMEWRDRQVYTDK